MKTVEGSSGEDVNICEPQDLQKLRVNSKPLLPVLVKLPSSPETIRNAAVAQRTEILKALPVQRLQSSQ